MRITVKQLREEVKKAGRGPVHASSAYMKKEGTREKVQDLVAEMVRQGEIADQASLDEAFETLDMAVKALKMVPFNAWVQMTTGVRPARKRQERGGTT